MNPPTSIAVVGPTGYAGCELANLLLRHPRIENLVFYLRDRGRDTGCSLTELFPRFRGWGEALCRPFSVKTVVSDGAGVVFLATPPAVSLVLAPELLAVGLRVVDLSGAFRFRQPETFTEWYKLPSPARSLLDNAAYGLPELFASSLPDAHLVANPGCYATSVILGLRPLAEAGWVAIDRGVVCDCKSGASGAGKEPRPDLHFVELNGNCRAYGLFEHRHTPEVLEHLNLPADRVMFATHLLPVPRGILSTLYVWLDAQRRPDEIEALYRSFYAERPLVRIWSAGQLPELQHVIHTNFCDIGFALDSSGKRLVVVACLDNLGKGAAGQAVQNLNLMLGYDEVIGLL